LSADFYLNEAALRPANLIVIDCCNDVDIGGRAGLAGKRARYRAADCMDDSQCVEPPGD
jgi:hypothetical protein